jgi:hypothetical protein
MSFKKGSQEIINRVPTRLTESSNKLLESVEEEEFIEIKQQLDANPKHLHNNSEVSSEENCYSKEEFQAESKASVKADSHSDSQLSSESGVSTIQSLDEEVMLDTAE